jgi:hypothetical protein
MKLVLILVLIFITIMLSTCASASRGFKMLGLRHSMRGRMSSGGFTQRAFSGGIPSARIPETAGTTVNVATYNVLSR